MRLKVTIADKVLFIALILLSLTSYALLHQIFPPGAVVSIKLRGETLYVLPLNEDKTITVEDSNGRNVIEIKQERVRISDASCSQKLCMKQGWINRGSLICLPNRLIVTVESRTKDNRKNNNTLDAVTR